MADHPDRSDVVAQAKQDLEAAGVDISGPCGAWRIVNLAAWRMTSDGAGILSKPDGENCAGYSTDRICYQDGAIYDVLISGGNVNGPAWQENPPVDPGRWRPAVFPSYLPGASEPPAPGPGPVDPDLGDLSARLLVLETWAAKFKAWAALAPR